MIALEAFARYGKGKRTLRRGSILADCFIYAQAKVGGASLLYKGDDFSKTDIAERVLSGGCFPSRRHLTVGLGVSISRGRTAEGNRDRVVGR